MKYFKSLFIIVAALVWSQTAVSQSKLSGKVVEVIDGKTAVVQIGTSGKLTVILQYVEIPEPEQPLHTVVKDHLEKLVQGKNALVIPRGITESSTVAQVFVDGTDVSQQMIRDGAAWFALPEKTEKSGAETEIYLSNETQARSEKRGVWGIEGLKPAWEFRAAKAERLRAEQESRLEEIKENSRNQRSERNKLPPPSAVSSNFELWKSGRTATLWDDMDILMGNPEYDQNGLFRVKFDKFPGEAYLTLPVILDLSGEKNLPKVSCQFGYFFRKDVKEANREFLGLGCRSNGTKEIFKTSNDLTFNADGKKMSFNKPIRFGQQSDERFRELLVYTLDRPTLLKLSEAKSVRLTLGKYSVPMSAKMHSMVKTMMIEISKNQS